MNIAIRPIAQDAGNSLDSTRPVTFYPHDSETAFQTETHRHRRAQLVYASFGVMTVTTATGTWVVPPQQAVWVPAGVLHQVSSQGALSMRSLYIHPSLTAELPSLCCVVTVRPLLRELILEVMRLPIYYAPNGPETRLIGVLLDELRRLKPVPLYLPSPRDRRLSIIAQALTANPADTRTLALWSQHTGASVRTLARLFIRDLGMSFSEWRNRLRIITAIERLALGDSVTTIALDLGYASPSAFIAMFRKIVGVSPTQYFRTKADALQY